MKIRTNTADFRIADKGAVIILMPQTSYAKDWVKNNLYLEAWREDDQIPVSKGLFLDEIMYDMEEEGMTMQAA